MRTAQDQRSVVLRTLLLDAVAARATAALAAAGIPAILLKGRAIADWLYAGEVRGYCDVDLLVDPAQRDRAVQVLGELGYHHWLAGADRVEYGPNELELVGPHQVCIDLHHTLIGMSVDPARCWAALSARTEQQLVGGRPVTVLDAGARTMHLALHVAQNGPADVKAVADLDRGVAQLGVDLWDDAVALAREVGALDAVAAGLHVSEAGARLARRSELRRPGNVELLLRTSSAPPAALQIQRLVETTGLGSRLRMIGRKVWPTVSYMAGREPRARAGRLGLLIARLDRLTGLPVKCGVAVSSWLAARRNARRLGAVAIERGEYEL